MDSTRQRYGYRHVATGRSVPRETCGSCRHRQSVPNEHGGGHYCPLLGFDETVDLLGVCAAWAPINGRRRGS